MKTQHIILASGLVIAGLLILAFTKGANEAQAPVIAEGALDTFASCLSEAGAKFYGAFWCPHCQDQKALFDDSKELPYIECSTPDGQGQLEICTTEKISGYPTWRFVDGSELNGVQPLSELAAKTSCALPS